MPQITLEYTRHLADADWTPIALEIHQAAVEIAGAALSACKTRLIALDHVVIADDAPETAMLACRIGLMLGRTPEQKSALSEAGAGDPDGRPGRRHAQGRGVGRGVRAERDLSQGHARRLIHFPPYPILALKILCRSFGVPSSLKYHFQRTSISAF